MCVAVFISSGTVKDHCLTGSQNCNGQIIGFMKVMKMSEVSSGGDGEMRELQE